MEQDGKMYSPEEIIGFTINILNDIAVPIGLHEQIGIPILQALSNLHGALEGLRDREAEQGQTLKDRPKPDPNEEKAIREEDL